MSRIPERRHYLTVFFVSLSLLMLEITAARILSVALFSHYAFVAVSLAMFGLGLSGLVIYLLPSRFPAARVDEQLTTYLSLFGLTTALSVLAFLHLHVIQELTTVGFATLGLAYAVLTVPYFLGGICVSLIMTHFSERIASIYYADLFGASIGCLAVVAALGVATAPQVAVVVAALVTGTALALTVSAAHRSALAIVSSWIVGVLLVLAFTTNLYTMRYVKHQTDFYSEVETWNSFSRVSAFQSDKNAAETLLFEMKPGTYPDDAYPPSKMLDIDGAAYTPMMGYNGDVSSIQFLRESVLYVAHSVRPNADVLVIGVGGGRDLLAAVAFGQKSILGIELNPLMRYVVEERYADYAGHPYTQPGVNVIVDEARSRLAGLDRNFDVIQLSLIDTFSLNSAGGFVFSENYLYTTEGFQEYFRHLSNDGILSLTRYYVPLYPLEILRVTAMARAAWEAEGVGNFKDHVVLLKQGLNATILVKKNAFTEKELGVLADEAASINSAVLYAPNSDSGDQAVTSLIMAPNWRDFTDSYPFLIDPPTDDRPFFFNFLRGLVREGLEAKDDPFRFLKQWNDALILMYMLMGVVTLMAVVFFLFPLLTFGGRQITGADIRVTAPLLLYFACLGYGFLMIEIPLLQRFMLMLGSPIYALAVVLFALLFFSGSGSLLSARFTDDPRKALTYVITAIVVLACFYVVLVPWLIYQLLGSSILIRIAATVALLGPIGLLLGMAYPLGITILRGYGEELVPWAWGLNGAMSVVASVLAIFIGSRIGFTAAFLTGVGAYALGLALILQATRVRPGVS